VVHCNKLRAISQEPNTPGASGMTKIRFSFEDLEVWQKSVAFAKKTIQLTEKINTGQRHYRLIDQLESASASIALNIAEGKGRYSKKEFVQFLYIARGSLYETITLLMIFYEVKWINEIQLGEFKQSADEIGKMLSALASSIKKSMVK
jgi:four helix bundle protein